MQEDNLYEQDKIYVLSIGNSQHLTMILRVATQLSPVITIRIPPGSTLDNGTGRGKMSRLS